MVKNPGVFDGTPLEKLKEANEAILRNRLKTLEYYRKMDKTLKFSWVSAHDKLVCDLCQSIEDKGIMSYETMKQSILEAVHCGSGRCRCTVSPRV